MADVFDPKQRSAVMRAVKSRDTAPEMKVRRAAHALGLRFRLNRADLPGKPDLVFPAKRTALFVSMAVSGTGTTVRAAHVCRRTIATTGKPRFPATWRATRHRTPR